MTMLVQGGGRWEECGFRGLIKVIKVINVLYMIRVDQVGGEEERGK
jgi:hypothetical protein